MKSHHAITAIKRYLPLYIITIIAAFIMRYISRINDSDVFCWILKPTAWWVSVISGIHFDYLPHRGFVNHFYKFLIAPECAGTRFMLIIFLMLIFSFLYRIKSVRSGYAWFGFSIFFAYVFTILVNGIRIAASIFIPIAFENLGFIGGWLTQDRLHTIIGTATYFSFMLAAYPLADIICRHGFIINSKINRQINCGAKYQQLNGEDILAQQDTLMAASYKFVIPAFWYLLAVLVIPFIGRIYRNEWEGFEQYAALIIGVCLAVTASGCLIMTVIRKKAP